MQQGKTQGKNLSAVTRDLSIHRGFNVRVKTVNEPEPKVLEINLAFYAIPREQLEDEEYEASISRIRKRFNRMCQDYVGRNQHLIGKKYITDFNFTPANLRKGYNKYVTMSLYVGQRDICRFNRVRNKYRESLRTLTDRLYDCMREEGFSCSKKKKVGRQR